MVCKLYTFCFLLLFSSCKENNAQFNYDEKIIYEDEKSGNVLLFVFFTDTHISLNKGNSLNIIKSVLFSNRCPTVFWGGDAIAARNGMSMEDEWKIQKAILDSISKYSNVYAIRGNHDFTYKDKTTGTGETLFQKEVSNRIMNSCSPNIVSDVSNDSACYYYVDDIVNKMRYIIFDTYDKGVYGNIPAGYKASINQSQLRWIVENAILTTPANYGIIILSHVPIFHHFDTIYKEAEDVLLAAKNKGQVRIGDAEYDFSQMETGTQILAILSGHRHHDMQVYSGGLLQIISTCDAFNLDYKRSPLAKYYPNRKKSELVVDLCAYNKEDNMLFLFRFGYGGSRFYHLNQIDMSVGDTLRLATTINSANIFGAYDSDAKYSSNNKKWSLNHNVVAIDNNGLVSAKKYGETIVYAINEDRDAEFFNIVVRK